MLKPAKPAPIAAQPVAIEPTRAAVVMQLRTTSPLRPVAGVTADVDGLALFDHARQSAFAF